MFHTKFRLRNCSRTSQKQRGLLSRRGVAAVEFAIIAPVFILLIVGFIEIGRAMMVQQVLTNASRVGAREATMLNTTELGVTTMVEDYATSVSIPNTTVVCSCGGW